ncbi:hypothetical protein ABD75_17845 [Bacillus vallismortis]|nr:hypothetical protein [Bacillus vallismortis]
MDLFVRMAADSWCFALEPLLKMGQHMHIQKKAKPQPQRFSAGDTISSFDVFVYPSLLGLINSKEVSK